MTNYIASNIKYLRGQLGEGQAELGERIGLSRDKIASYERGTEPKIATIDLFVDYFHVSIEDFIHTDLSKTKSTNIVTKKNPQEKTKSKENVILEKGDKKGDISEKNEKYNLSHQNNEANEPHVKHDFRLRTDVNQTAQNIPLYNIEATAGLVPLFNKAGGHTPVDFINIPNVPRCDGAIYVTGDSMYPLLKSGDIVLYKQINDVLNNIFWGEMYLVSIDMEGEEYVTVKYIQKSEKANYIKLVSHNQHHSDKEVHISKVVALAFIKASIRINSMK